MNELSEGVRAISAITKLHGEKRYVGMNGVKSMTIRMQAGEGGMVPWLQVCYEKGTDIFLNCSALEGVRLAPKEGKPKKED